MAWHSVMPLYQLSARKQVNIRGQELLLINDNKQVTAIQAKCPHLKLPLIKGKIENCAITCPFHKSKFDLQTGKVISWSPWPIVIGKLLGKLSKPKPLKIFPTKIEDGMILVDI